jgi:hypothetical protein
VTQTVREIRSRETHTFTDRETDRKNRSRETEILK